MNSEIESESIIISAQKHFKDKLDAISAAIRNSSEDFQNDPLLLTLKQDPVTEAYVPLRLKELYEDRTTKELIEGLKKELSQTITEYYLEMNARLNLERNLNQERQEKKEALEEVGILKLSIKELESNLENLRVKYETGMKSKQNEILESKGENKKKKKVLEDFERLNSSMNEEISVLKTQLEKEKLEKSRIEDDLGMAKKENEGNRKKLNILEDEHYNLNAKFKECTREIEYLNSQIFRISTEKHELEESTSFFKMTVENEKEKELNDCKSQVKEIKKKLGSKLDETKEELDKKGLEIEGYKHKISDLEHCLSISQHRYLEDKNELSQALELSKCDYEDSINNVLKQNEYEIRVIRKKHENELDDQKSYYKSVIKSQMDEFEARAAGFYQREKEKDEQYSYLVKDLNESYIEKKTHSVIVTEQLEQAKNAFQKTLKNAEIEINEKWEKELKKLVQEKNSKIDELKHKLEEGLIENEKASRKIGQLEKIIENEKIKHQELFEKNENLKTSLAEMQQTKANFSDQLVQVSNIVSQLKAQLSEIQAQKSELENQNLNLEQQINLIEKCNQETSNVINKKNLDLQSETLKYLEKIEDLNNESSRLNNELNKKVESYKLLEKRFNEFKANAKDTADKYFAEVSAEKDKSRNTLQKVLQDLELTKIELEMLEKKHQKTVQDLYFSQSQLKVAKEQLEAETNTSDNLKSRVSEFEDRTDELENINEELRLEVLRKNKEFSVIFKEIFHKFSFEMIEIKKLFIEEIKLLNNETFDSCSELSNSMIRVFNNAKLIWLKEKEELHRELVACKFENNKYRELLTETDENNYEEQQKLKNVIQNMQTELMKREDTGANLTSKIQSFEKNQADLQGLLQERESEIFKLKQHFEQTLNESEVIYSETQCLNEYYRTALSDFIRNFSSIEDFFNQSFDGLSNEISQLKIAIRQEMDEIHKKNQEVLSYKEALLATKEKNAEYYKDMCLSLEKDAKRVESQFLGKISDLESQLKESSFRFKSFEREHKQKRLNESEELFKRKFD